MTEVSSESGLWAPDFQPDWPEVVPIGTWVVRSMIYTSEEPDEDIPEGLSWKILFARGAEGGPRHALVGELTVRDGGQFAGITVVSPFALREEPEEPTDETDMAFLRRYGHWASSYLYDYAATSLRTSIAGSGFTLDVQWSTPLALLPQLDEPT